VQGAPFANALIEPSQNIAEFTRYFVIYIQRGFCYFLYSAISDRVNGAPAARKDNFAFRRNRHARPGSTPSY